jgi:hypothetical protein
LKPATRATSLHDCESNSHFLVYNFELFGAAKGEFLLTVDTNEPPHIERDHQLTAHGSESHPHKVWWIVAGIVLFLGVVIAIALLWSSHEDAKKKPPAAAEDFDYDHDRLQGRHRHLSERHRHRHPGLYQLRSPARSTAW